MENKKLVIFDFDGVLVDTLIASYSVFNEVNEGVTLDEFKTLFEGNIIESVGSKKLIQHSDYFGQYDKQTRELKVPGILKETIEKLKDNYTLVIVSSTNTSSIVKILERNNVLAGFEDILGADISYNKVEKINAILKKYNKGSEDVVFITDTSGDIKEGMKCGVKSIAVTWGFHDRETLKRANPVAIIDDPKELFETIKNVVK
jgi:phosphoglycolate phosphatase